MACRAMRSAIASVFGRRKNSQSESPGARYRRPQCKSRLDRLEDPAPKSPLSTSRTSWPAAATCCAALAPLTPAPITATAKDFPSRLARGWRIRSPFHERPCPSLPSRDIERIGAGHMFIRQLEAFRATMQAGTVSGAAVLLGVSQPAASRLLGRLEKELKLTLFDRSKGRLVPTPEAQILYDQVERTFVSADKIREVAAEISTAQAGHLHVAALPAIGLGFLPAVIEEFNRAHPQVTITLEVNLSARVEESVAAQHVDLGIGQFPFRRTGIESEVFCSA